MATHYGVPAPLYKETFDEVPDEPVVRSIPREHEVLVAIRGHLDPGQLELPKNGTVCAWNLETMQPKSVPPRGWTARLRDLAVRAGNVRPHVQLAEPRRDDPDDGGGDRCRRRRGDAQDRCAGDDRIRGRVGADGIAAIDGAIQQWRADGGVGVQRAPDGGRSAAQVRRRARKRRFVAADGTVVREGRLEFEAGATVRVDEELTGFEPMR